MSDRTDLPSFPPNPPTAPVPPAAPTDVRHRSDADGSQRRLVALLALAVIAVAAFGALWVNERSRAEGLADDLAALEADIASEAAAQKAEEDARPDLMAIAEAIEESDSSVEFSGGADALSVTAGAFSLDWVEEYLDQTGFPAATIERIRQTRALDGTLEAEGDKVTATWTYHPDDGLSIVFCVDE